MSAHLHHLLPVASVVGGVLCTVLGLLLLVRAVRARPFHWSRRH